MGEEFLVKFCLSTWLSRIAGSTSRRGGERRTHLPLASNLRPSRIHRKKAAPRAAPPPIVKQHPSNTLKLVCIGPFFGSRRVSRQPVIPQLLSPFFCHNFSELTNRNNRDSVRSQITFLGFLLGPKKWLSKIFIVLFFLLGQPLEASTLSSLQSIHHDLSLVSPLICRLSYLDALVDPTQKKAIQTLAAQLGLDSEMNGFASDSGLLGELAAIKDGVEQLPNSILPFGDESNTAQQADLSEIVQHMNSITQLLTLPCYPAITTFQDEPTSLVSVIQAIDKDLDLLNSSLSQTRENILYREGNLSAPWPDFLDLVAQQLDGLASSISNLITNTTNEDTNPPPEDALIRSCTLSISEKLRSLSESIMKFNDEPLYTHDQLTSHLQGWSGWFEQILWNLSGKRSFPSAETDEELIAFYGIDFDNHIQTNGLIPMIISLTKVCRDLLTLLKTNPKIDFNDPKYLRKVRYADDLMGRFCNEVYAKYSQIFGDDDLQGQAPSGIEDQQNSTPQSLVNINNNVQYYPGCIKTFISKTSQKNHKLLFIMDTYINDLIQSSADLLQFVQQSLIKTRDTVRSVPQALNNLENCRSLLAISYTSDASDLEEPVTSDNVDLATLFQRIVSASEFSINIMKLLAQAELPDPATLPPELWKFLPTDSTLPDTPATLLFYLNTLSSSLEQLHGYGEKLQSNPFQDYDFLRFLELFSQQYSQFTEFLYEGYQRIIEQKTDQYLEKLQWPTTGPTTFSDCIQALNSQLETWTELPDLLAQIIVHAAKFNSRFLNDTFYNLLPFFEQLRSLTFENSLKLIPDSDDSWGAKTFRKMFQQDGETLSWFQQIALSLAFQAEHTTCWEEYITSLGYINSYVMVWDQLLQEINAIPALNATEESKGESSPTENLSLPALPLKEIENITAEIEKITIATGAVASLLGNASGCIMNHAFTEQIRIFVDACAEITMQLASAYKSVTGNTLEVALPLVSPEFTPEDQNQLLRSIIQNILHLSPSLQQLLQLNAEIKVPQTEDIQSMSGFRGQLESLVNALTESPNSLFQKLVSNNEAICCHKVTTCVDEIKLLSNTLDEWTATVDPVNALCPAYQSIQVCCYKMYRYLKALLSCDTMYTWERQSTWIEIVESLTTFLKNIEPKSLAQANFPILKTYLDDVSAKFEALCDQLNQLLAQFQIPNFVPDFSQKSVEHGCHYISQIYGNIGEILSSCPNDFESVFVDRFDKSDYALNQTLTDAVSRLTECLHSVSSQLCDESKTPIFTQFCTGCGESVDLSEVRESLSKLFDFLENKVKSSLSAPLCCRKPRLILQSITEKTVILSSITNLIAKSIGVADISLSTTSSLNNQWVRINNSLDTIITALDTMTSRISEENATPCIQLRCLEELTTVEAQLSQIDDAFTRVAALLGASYQEPSEQESQVMETENACINFVGTRLSSCLEELASNFTEFRSNLSMRNQTVFTKDLYESFIQFHKKIRIMINNYKMFYEAIAQADGVTCSHLQLSDFEQPLENIQTAINEIPETYKSFCCSSTSVFLCQLNVHLQEMSQYIKKTFEGYSFDAPSICVPDEVISALSSVARRITVSFERVKNKITHIKDDFCILCYLTPEWLELQQCFADHKNVLNTLLILQNVGSLEPVQSDSPSKHASEHVGTVIDAYNELVKNLQDLAEKLQTSPPLLPLPNDLLTTLPMIRVLFSHLDNLVGIFKTSFSAAAFDGDSLPTDSSSSDLCSGCQRVEFTSAPVVPPLGSTAESLEGTLTTFDCCAYAAAEFNTTAHHFRKLQNCLHALAQLPALNLHSAYEERFLKLLDVFTSAFSKFCQESFADFVTAYTALPEGVCQLYKLFHPFQRLNEDLGCVVHVFFPLARCLGAKPGSDEFVTLLGEDLTGNERMTLIAKDLATTAENMETDLRDLVALTQKPVVRKTPPVLLTKLENIAPFFTQIAQQFQTISSSSSTRGIPENDSELDSFQQKVDALSQIAAFLVQSSQLFSNDAPPSLLEALRGYHHSLTNQLIYEMAVDFTAVSQLWQALESLSLWSFSYSVTPTSSFEFFQSDSISLWQHLEILDSYLQEHGFEDSSTLDPILRNVSSDLHSLRNHVEAFVVEVSDSFDFLPKPASIEVIPHFYQATNDVLGTWKDCLQQHNSLLKTLITKVTNGEILYAQPSSLSAFLSYLASPEKSTTLRRILTIITNCPHCRDLSSLSLLQAEINTWFTNFTSLQKTLLYPTCFRKLEIAGQKAAQKAEFVAQICEEYLHYHQAKLCFDTSLFKILSQFCSHLVAHKQLIDAATFQTVTPQKIEALAQEIDAWTENFWGPLAITLQQFLALIGFPVGDIPESIWLPSLAFNEQIDHCQKAFEKLPRVWHKTFEIARNTPVIPYCRTLVHALSEASEQLNLLPEKLQGLAELSHQAPWGHYANDPTLEASFINSARDVQNLRAQFVALHDDLEQKCCSRLYVVLADILASLQTFQANLAIAVDKNPQYPVYLRTLSNDHSCLTFVTQQTLPALVKTLGGLQTALFSLPCEETPSFCYSTELLPHFEELDSICGEAVQQSQDFCHHFKLEAVSYPPVVPSSWEDFGHSLIEVLSSLQLTLMTIQDLHATISYTDDTAHLNQLFFAFNQELNTLRQSLQSFTERGDIVICSKCTPWTHLFLRTAVQLLHPIEISKSGETTSTAHCCQALVQELAILQQHLEMYTSLQDQWLLRYEKKILQGSNQPLRYQQRSLNEADLHPFLSTLAHLSTYMAQADNVLDRYYSYVAHLDFSSQSCHVHGCLPYIRELNNLTLQMNHVLMAALRARPQPCSATPKHGELPCIARIHTVVAIFQSLQKALGRWHPFQGVWKNLTLLPHSQNFVTTIGDYSKLLLRICERFQNSAEFYSAEEGTSRFCSACPSENSILNAISSLPSVDELESVFDSILQKAACLCSSVWEQSVRQMGCSTRRITAFLHKLRSNNECVALLASSSAPSSKSLLEDAWNHLSLPIEGIALVLRKWSDLSVTTPSCLSEALYPVCESFVAATTEIEDVFQSMSECLNFKYESEEPFFTEDVDATQLPILLEDLSLVWYQLCQQLSDVIPDKDRARYRQVFSNIVQHLRTLETNLVNLPLSFVFCGQKSASKHFDFLRLLQDPLENILVATEYLVKNLHGDNCCDAHVHCLYNLVQRLPVLQRIFTTLSASELLALWLPCMDQSTEIVDRIHHKLHLESLRSPRPSCIFAAIKDEFENLEKIIISSLTIASQKVSSVLPTFVNWDDFSASSRHDCHYLADFYADLETKCSELVTVVTERFYAEDPSSFVVLANTFDRLGSSLRALYQMLVSRQPLCTSCPGELILRNLHHIAETFVLAGQRFQFLPEWLILQANQKIAERSVMTLNCFVDAQNNNLRPLAVYTGLPHEASLDLRQRLNSLTQHIHSSVHSFNVSIPSHT